MLGTFLLVFLGTAAICLDAQFPNCLGNLGIALVFGAAVFIIIELFGNYSGAHINPAVSLALQFSQKIGVSTVLFYVIAQLAGAILASICVKFIWPYHPDLGATYPKITAWWALYAEFISSFFLMLIILMATSPAKKINIRPSILIGATVSIAAALFGPISGASMNPARSFGPAVVAQNYDHLPLYLLVPTLGMVLSAIVYSKYSKK